MYSLFCALNMSKKYKLIIFSKFSYMRSQCLSFNHMVIQEPCNKKL